jgi:hypothetical protein
VYMKKVNYWDTPDEKRNAGKAWNIMSYILSGVNDYTVDKESLKEVVKKLNKTNEIPQIRR